MKKKSAFPHPATLQNVGLSERKLIAAMALQGILAQSQKIDPLSAAMKAKDYADALLIQLGDS